MLGGPGVGKTLLGQHFALAGLRVGEPAVILGFHERRREMLRKAAPFAVGARLRAALAPGGGLTLLRLPPVERDADVLAEPAAGRGGPGGGPAGGDRQRGGAGAGGARRPATRAASPATSRRCWRPCGARGATTLLIRETGVVVSDGLRLEADMVSLLAASVIWLQQVSRGGRLRRVLSVPKMRFSAHDLALREYAIAAPEGLHVLGPLEGEEG